VPGELQEDLEQTETGPTNLMHLAGAALVAVHCSAMANPEHVALLKKRADEWNQPPRSRLRRSPSPQRP
jgi:hypothetical protein